MMRTILPDLGEVGLQAEEDDDAFFTQAAEAEDEADTAYYRRKADQGNADDPSHSRVAQGHEDIVCPSLPSIKPPLQCEITTKLYIQTNTKVVEARRFIKPF